jgi:autotransporter-associated beta strand protein
LEVHHAAAPEGVGIREHEGAIGNDGVAGVGAGAVECEGSCAGFAQAAGAAAYTIGSGSVGSQTLTLNNSGNITVQSSVANNQLLNAALLLGTDGTAQTFSITNNSTSASLGIDGSITGSTGAGNKTLLFSGAGNTLVSGAIGNGAGGGVVLLTKNGTGTLTLSGSNTYTGATTVNSGTLATSADDLISNSSAVTVASGASFKIGGNETVGSIAGAGIYIIDPYTLTAGADNTSTTASGLITGFGGLVKTGNGTLTLSSANSYFGGTALSSGTIQIANAGALGTSGNISFSGGTLQYGTGTTTEPQAIRPAATTAAAANDDVVDRKAKVDREPRSRGQCARIRVVPRKRRRERDGLCLRIPQKRQSHSRKEKGRMRKPRGERCLFHRHG